MEIKSLLNEILSDFNGNYKDLLSFVYLSFQKRIDSTKNKNIKNKYIKIRKSILQYILSNEKIITLEILKKKIK